jgi:hypothetical protein
MSSGNDLLMSGGTPWAKFPVIGSEVDGIVVSEPEARQQRDYDDNTPLTWPNGDPRMEVVVDLDTAERDPNVEGDTGRRALHIKGFMTEAVRKAVRAVGADGLEIGGRLRVRYTADGEKKGRNDPPKLYAAVYARPQGAGNGALMGNGNGARSQQPEQPPEWARPAVPPLSQLTQPSAWPAQQQTPGTQASPTGPFPLAPAAPAASGYAASMTAPAPSAPPPGVDPATWAAMGPAQQAAVLAALQPVQPGF